MPATQFLKSFQGLSIFPLKGQPTNVRKAPAYSAAQLTTLTKVTRATGRVALDADGKRFWIELDTPAGKGWSRSDVTSWAGKTSSELANLGKPVLTNPTPQQQFNPALKGAPANFLATSPTVNIRKSPGMDSAILTSASKVAGSRLGNLTGVWYQLGNETWLQIEVGAVTGYVRSDVVHWQGAKSTAQIVTGKATEAVKATATVVGSGVMALIQPLLVPAAIVGGIYYFITKGKRRAAA